MASFDTNEMESLVEQLAKDLQTAHSARVVIPVCHMYLEYILRLLLAKRLSREEFERLDSDWNFGFNKKLKKLNEMGEFSTEEYYDLDTINRIRNDLVHEFNTTLEDIRDRGVSLHFHQFNENRNPTDVILNDILSLMQELEKHFLDNFQTRQ